MRFIKFIIFIIIVFVGLYFYQIYFTKGDLSQEQLQIRGSFGVPDQFVVAYVPEEKSYKKFEIWFYVAHHKKFYFMNGKNISNEDYDVVAEDPSTSLRPSDFSRSMKFADVAGVLGALNIDKIYSSDSKKSDVIQMYESEKAVFIIKNNDLLYLQTKGVDDEDNQLINSDIIKIFMDQGKTEGVELVELLISKSVADLERDYALDSSYLDELKNKAFSLLEESKDSGKALIGESVGDFFDSVVNDFIENIEKERATTTQNIKDKKQKAVSTFEMTKKKNYKVPLNISGCKNGYYFDPEVGCLQKDCDNIDGAYVGDDGRCVCKSFGCYRVQDYEECPSCVYVCMDQEGVCP